MTDKDLRDQICVMAKSLFDRRLTGGSTGNISARTEDGGLLVSPTGTSFGRMDPARLSRFHASGCSSTVIRRRKRCRFTAPFANPGARPARWCTCIPATLSHCR